MIPDDNDVPVTISDSDLLMRVAEKQDREAFARLFKSIAPRIKGYMMKLGAGPEAAEEIARGSAGSRQTFLYRGLIAWRDFKKAERPAGNNQIAFASSV
jgi:hypothetical protein